MSDETYQAVKAAYRSYGLFIKLLSEEDEWERYIVDAPPFLNSLETMEPGKGYWVDAKAACPPWTIPHEASHTFIFSIPW